MSKESVLDSGAHLEDDEPPCSESGPEIRSGAPLLAPSSPPPPFSSLYFPSTLQQAARKASITEPEPPPPFCPVNPTQPGSSAPGCTLERDIKAAIPRDSKGESSSKAADEAEPPPPYTDGSSPLDSFTYVMAAAGGPASIITQVQQTGPQQGNSLAGGFALDWSFALRDTNAND